MRIGEMKDSKFMKKEDVGEGKLVTIAELEQQNVAMDDQPPELKWIMHFKELDKYPTDRQSPRHGRNRRMDW